jgi:hypothetical protein
MGKQSRRKRDRQPPPIPEAVRESARLLGEAWKVTDPTATYRLDMGNGETFTATGRELLETANAMKAFIRAVDRNDDDATRRALERLGFGPPNR